MKYNVRHSRTFPDRRTAGRDLARALNRYSGRGDVLVLALPRGGVPVADEIARFLGAPLDILIVRKLGVPGQPELALGAIASGGARAVNDEIVEALGIDPAIVDAIADRERMEILRREQAYRGDRPPIQVAGKVVIVVDDGMATGATMRAGVRALRALQPARLVVAVPHAPTDTCASLSAETDELVCLEMPEPYVAVGRWYQDFPQLTDAEVREILGHAAAGRSA
ncbi:MAG: phosphoribosyltransferase [Gammaproteobacteria bacterium]|nr:phosphoribosyltransferase [Gammaproteobacteria bacterium]